jgi:hypothetical protein
MRFYSEYLQGEDFRAEAVDDPQEWAGDPYAELEESDCPCDPLGHLVKAECGCCRCISCGRIAWI